MDEKRTAICDRCKGMIPISNIKYVQKGDDTFSPVCKACIDNSQSKPAEHKPRSQSISKARYRWLRCKYGFGHDKGTERELKCPYCGKNDKVVEDTADATSLLREVDDDNFINQ